MNKNVTSLIKAYNNTHFIIDGFKQPIIIDEKSLEVDIFLRSKHKLSWAFITAYNPGSNFNTKEVNKRNQSRLEKDIQKYIHITGQGEDPIGNWDPEQSYFIAGIPKSEAVYLGKKYEQLAIVFGEINKKAELLILNK